MTRKKKSRRPSYYWIPLFIDDLEDERIAITWVSDKNEKEEWAWKRLEDAASSFEGVLHLYRVKRDAEKYIRKLGFKPNSENLIKVFAAKRKGVSKC